MASNSIAKTDSSNDDITIASAITISPRKYFSAGGKTIPFNTFDSFMERYNNRFLSNELDVDAQAWITAIESAGGVVNSVDRDAINTCVVGLKAIDYWNDIYSMGLFWFGNEAANSVRAKIGGNITFPGGTRNHNIDYLRFSGNGYADLGFNHSTAGATNISMGLILGFPATILSINGVDIGAVDNGNWCAMFMNFNGADYYWCGMTSPNPVAASNTTPGVYAGNKSGTDSQLLYHGLLGPTVIDTESSTGVGGLATGNIFLGAANDGGTPAFITNRPYSFWLVPNKGVSQEKLELALPIIYTMLATRGLGTEVNSPVTNLLITEAQDDGNETGTINFSATWTKPYATSFGRVRVTINDVTVYEEDQDISNNSISLTGISAVPGDDVDIYIAVLGTTGHTALSSDWVTDGDTVLADLDPDVVAYAAEIDADSSITLTSDQKTLLNDWILAGDANGWRTHLGAAMFFCWNNLEANLVRMIYGGNGSVFIGSPIVNPLSMTLNFSGGYLTSELNAANLGITTSSVILCHSNIGTPPQGGATAIGTGEDMDHYRLFAAGATCYFDHTFGDLGRVNGDNVSPIRMGVRNGTNQAIYGYNGTIVTTIASATKPIPTAINAGNILVGRDDGSATRNYTAAFMGTGNGMTSTIAGDFLIDTYTLLDALGAL